MRRFVFALSALVALLLLLPGVAYAQATRTWISGVGDDANPCSRTAPCKTWAGAISKTSPGGEIDALDPGGFGALTITKAITLDGGGGQVASTLASGTPGFTVSAGANDVVIIRNVRINGIQQSGSPGTNGIRFNTGAALIVENCDIFGFSTWGIDFENTTATSSLSVVNTVIANNGSSANGGGVLIEPGSGATVKAGLSGVKMLNNGVGIRVSGDNTTTGTLVTIDNSQAFGNANAGFSAETGSGAGNGSVLLMLNAVDASDNLSAGLKAQGTGASILLGNSTVSGNATGALLKTGGQISSYKNNQINGNTTDGTPLPAVSGTGGLN
jgi:hypothetical protein